jgi:hypothetical protein
MRSGELMMLLWPSLASWTRPNHAGVTGAQAAGATITRRFRGYRPCAAWRSGSS